MKRSPNVSAQRVVQLRRAAANPAITRGLIVLGWMTCYIVVLVWSVSTLIEPKFGYQGYVPRDTSAMELILGVGVSVLVSLTLAQVCRRPSDVAYLFLVLTIAIPVIWFPLLYGSLSTGQASNLVVCVAGSFVLIWLCLRGTRRPLILVRMSGTAYGLLIGTFCVVSVAYLFWLGLRPQILVFADVYTQRAQFGKTVDGVGAYLVGWLTGGAFPVILACGLYRRSMPLILLGVSGLGLIYAMTGFKSYILGVGILMVMSFMTRRGTTSSWHWIGMLASFIVLVGGLDLMRNGFGVTSLLVRRGLSTAGINSAYYVQRFDGGPFYELRHSIFRFFGTPPYDAAPAILVGRTYYIDGTNANANFVADGFANFGWLGILLSAVVVGLLLRVYDRLTLLLPLGISAPALVFVLQAMANTAILTVFATHGAALLLVWVALLPTSAAAVRNETFGGGSKLGVRHELGAPRNARRRPTRIG